MKCEICGKDATTICPRCYRYVCENCLDPATDYCIDCSSFKRAQEEDYVRVVESLWRKIVFIEENMERCFECPLLKDEIMRSMRILKELEIIAKSEGFENLHDKILSLKDKVQNVGVNYLVRFKMKTLKNK